MLARPAPVLLRLRGLTLLFTTSLSTGRVLASSKNVGLKFDVALFRRAILVEPRVFRIVGCPGGLKLYKNRAIRHPYCAGMFAPEHR